MKGDNSSGIAAVILGITGIVFSSLGGIILGITGLVFALKQKKSAPNKWSAAGLILNIISIILGIIISLAAFIYAYNAISSVIPIEGLTP